MGWEGGGGGVGRGSGVGWGGEGEEDSLEGGDVGRVETGNLMTRIYNRTCISPL